MPSPLFPRWANRAGPLLGVLLGLGPPYLALLLAYGGSPDTTDVGYQPVQPVPNSHALHVGQLGMDCRFCHTGAERGAHAGLPTAASCQTCHGSIRKKSERLELVRRAETGNGSLRWTKVHDLPDFVFFDHQAHVTRGVACSSCHGAVERMEQVGRTTTLSMRFCLDCHRAPEAWLRPLDQVTNPGYLPPADPVALGRELRARYAIEPSTDCSACHH